MQFVPVGCSGRRIAPGDAGELVHAVVRRRLQLVPVVHAVIALELGVVRQRVTAAPPCWIVQVELVRLVQQREEEEIGLVDWPGQFMLGTPSERKPCAQSSKLLVLVVSTSFRVGVTRRRQCPPGRG